ncbi:MAG: hypothetical protein ACRBBP_05050 [Bdellovibrionales bacterium]
MKLFLTTLVLFFSSANSFAAEKPNGLGASSIALLEKEIEIDNGYGEGHYYDAASTLAQNLVNQGFAMLNLFQYTDAFRSFDTALKEDSNLKIAVVGRGFSSLKLDAQNKYYTDIALDSLKSDLGALDKTTKAWGNLLSSLVSASDLNNQPLSPTQAYGELKEAKAENFDVMTFGNWISESYMISDFQDVLNSDPANAGALHYMLHMSEGQNDHTAALEFGERLIKIATSSAHAQHMYGHVLPHFNRWNEADEQFTIADSLHNAWAEKNNVSPSEDWHYYHNLDLWSVSKMVVDPQGALNVLGQIQSLNTYALLDYLDYASATFPENAKTQIEGVLDQVEAQSPDLKNLVLSSRLYYNVVFNPGQSSFNDVVVALNSGADFKNGRLLYMFLTLLQTKDANTTEYLEIQKNIVDGLRVNFERGGFDGWKKSVLEALMYRRLFQLYGLDDSLVELEKVVFNSYMNPVD